MKRKNEKGFTLIELLIVISIIGFLSAITIVSINGARAKARDSRRLTDVRSLKQGLELYYEDYGVFPFARSLCKSCDQGDSTFPICNSGCMPTGYTAWIPGLDRYLGPMPEEKDITDKEYFYYYMSGEVDDDESVDWYLILIKFERRKQEKECWENEDIKIYGDNTYSIFSNYCP